MSAKEQATPDVQELYRRLAMVEKAELRRIKAFKELAESLSQPGINLSRIGALISAHVLTMADISKSLRKDMAGEVTVKAVAKAASKVKPKAAAKKPAAKKAPAKKKPAAAEPVASSA